MLTEIKCDVLDAEFHTVKFRQGLNIVLGTSNGSSALGKTIFLQLIEFCFGGEIYMASDTDIRNHVQDHVVYFTFHWDDDYYFYRDTSRLNYVCRCDIKGNLIEEMPIRKYRQLISEKYGLVSDGADIVACMEHHFRIYGKDNVQERYPHLSKSKGKDDEAVDFLLRLFGDNNILNNVHAMEQALGVKESEFKKTETKTISEADIDSLNEAITTLKKRQKRLMQNKDDERLVLLGLNTSSAEKAARLQKELRQLVQKRNEYVAKKEAILAGNEQFCNEVVEQDLEDLKEFFPGVNVKALDDIQHFHIRIREILADEASQEADKLQQLIDQCDKEIADLQRRIDEAGYTTEMAGKIISQAVSISREIDKKQDELDKLQNAKAQQEEVEQAEDKMAELIEREWKLIRKMQKIINSAMESYNMLVTEDNENAPTMGIGKDKTIYFGTYGNTSESAAFKGLVLYDLAILKNSMLPVLVHDSNIIRRINRAYYEKLFQLYETSKKQAFIVLDSTDGLSDALEQIIEHARVITLSESHRLFGKSWANMKDKKEGK
ncbi:Uncharacterized protein YydD, contains DUF2326 domain [Butyrivibrio sp. INlla18]|uniref:DUF2326 domain-containing protein n=1 Tax=Butyrivibrio sp. INlla18 TaxID=1520806 RepID=UPI0008836593|nr:DUF2326 domain-containing protein [Butyrivibrio sp. INlla18]SDA39049.1 Uncharacterized protein YydD, contains DUF2326 domain [Butyrivibrio sp. INlla18]